MDRNLSCPVCNDFTWESIGVQEYSRDLLHHPHPYARIRFEMLFSTWFPHQEQFTLEFLLCKNCGMVIYSPRPDEADLAACRSFFATHPVASKEFTSHLASDRVRADQLFSYLKPFIPAAPKKARILDFGGGNGRLLGPFQEQGHECGVIDLLPDTLPGIHWYGKDIHELGDDQKFDIIICSHVVEHLREPKLVLDSLASLLAQQGIVYIEVPSEMREGVPFEVEPATHINYYSEWTIGKLLEASGLEVIRVDEGIYTSETNTKALAIRGIGRRTTPQCSRYGESLRGGQRSKQLMDSSPMDRVLFALRFPSLARQKVQRRTKQALSRTPFLWRLASRL